MQAIEVDLQSNTSDVHSTAPSASSDTKDHPINDSESVKAEPEIATPYRVRSHTLSISEDVPSEQPSNQRRNSFKSISQVSVSSELEYAANKRSARRKRLFIVMLATISAAPLAIFTFYYLQQALVSEDPQLGLLFLDPSATLTLVSVLTESLATILPLILTYLFDSFPVPRKQPDDCESSPDGASSEASWSQLRRLKTGFIDGTRFFTSWQMLLLPLLGLLLGIVTKVNMSITPVFSVQETLPVFAGLSPLNASLLQHGLVPVAVLGTYFAAWTSSMIGVSKFVIPIDPVRCARQNCTSIFLPGGLEGVRRLYPNLNHTLLDSGIFEKGDAIITYNATGYHLEYSPNMNGFSFNRSVDCILKGASNDQGIYICVGSKDEYLFAGWSICPTSLQETNSCFNDTTWTYPTQQNTSLLAYKRRADTAYLRQDLSIIGIQKITPATSDSIVRYNSSDFLYIFDKLLTADSSMPSDDVTMVDATLYELGWSLRLYAELFRDEHHSPETLLMNFLTIPIHFSATAWDLANSTVETIQGNNLSYALPDDLITTASSVHMRYRLKAADWTVYVFIVLSTSLLVYVIALLVFILATMKDMIEKSNSPV